ncbi:MAG: hypothetical protein HDS10_01985 [Bacteroides sp.]|nr:hypothetical protein [Bacteroides sp.]
MKKVVLSLAVLFSMAMVSCGGNKAAEAQDSDSVVAVEETVVEEVAVDSAAPVADSAAAPAADSAAAAQ